MAAEYDVLIRFATVYDGTGAPPRLDDVALRGDRIARIGGLGDARAPVTIDATGLALAPGFIDVHTHDDFALVLRPEMDFKILGGVTTVVSRWFVMPTADRSSGRTFARASAPRAARSCESQISFASCSTQPGSR